MRAFTCTADFKTYANENDRPKQSESLLAKIHYNKVQNVGNAKLNINAMIAFGRAEVLQSLRSILNHFANYFATETHAKDSIAVCMGPVKSTDRTKQKMWTDYGYDLLKVTDIIRASVVVKTPAHLEDVVCKFRTWIVNKFGTPADPNKKKHYRDCKVVLDKDRFSANRPNPDPSGYRDFLMLVQCNWGNPSVPFIVEIQFHLCSMLLAKGGAIATIRTTFNNQNFVKNGHKLYGDWRTAEVANQPALVTQMNALYTAAEDQGAQAACDLYGVPHFEPDAEGGVEHEENEVTIGKDLSPEVNDQPTTQ